MATERGYLIHMVPGWLHFISLVFVVSGVASALTIAFEIALGRRQKMRVMDWVWPVTALYLGPLGYPLFRHFGDPLEKPGAVGAPWYAEDQQDRQEHRPFWEKVFVAVTHCGAGCTLGDIAGEWIVFLTAFTIGGAYLWPEFILDFALAFIFGLAFQYLTIAPLRHERGWPGIKDALKADTISLLAFEVGLFAWIALMRLVFFRNQPLRPTDLEFWFMMQVGMMVGFLTAYPVNWWLLRSGLKEPV